MPATKGPTKTIQARDFKDGLNRTAARTAIKDSQLFWNENVQPIGAGQQKILEPPGPHIANINPTPLTLWGVNLKLAGAEVKRLIVISANGAIWSLDPTTGIVTPIVGPGAVTLDCRLTVWEDAPVLFADPTTGYHIWDGLTFLTFPLTLVGDTHSSAVVDAIAPNTSGLVPGMAISGSGIPIGTTILTVDSATQVTLDTGTTTSLTGTTLTIGAGAPTSCRDVAVFEGRVWLLVGLRSIAFSAPDSYTDFSVASGGGVATIPDSVFIGKITRLLSALELLWIVGPAAVNAISNVQSFGAPVVTTFSDTNIVANVGSVRPASVASFFRTFLFLAQYGVYAIVGATPQKLSDDLDGLLPFIQQTPEQINPAAVFSLNRVFIWTVLVTYLDPVVGARPMLLCFAKNAWFLASQGDDLAYITGLVDPDTGEPELWGCNTTGAIFRCFVGLQPGPYLWQTKLWDFGMFVQMKQALRIAFEFFSENGDPIDANVFLESEIGSQSVPLLVTDQNSITWLGDNGAVVTFIGDNGEAIIWTTSGFTLARAENLNMSGHYLGYRVQGTSRPYTLSAVALEYDPMGEWT